MNLRLLCCACAFIFSNLSDCVIAQKGQELATSKSLRLFLEHELTIKDIGFRPLVLASSPSGNMLALGGSTREIAVWNLTGPKAVEVFRTKVQRSIPFPPHPKGRKRPFVSLYAEGFVAIRMEGEQSLTAVLPSGALIRLNLSEIKPKLTQNAIGKTVSSAVWDDSGHLWIGTGRGSIHRIEEDGKVAATMRPVDDIAPVSFLHSRGPFLFTARQQVYLPRLTIELMKSEEPWPHAGLTIWNRRSLKRTQYLEFWDGSQDVMAFSRDKTGGILAMSADTPREGLPWGPKKRTLLYKIGDQDEEKCQLRMDLNEMRKVRSKGKEIFALTRSSRLQSLDKTVSLVSPYQSDSMNPVAMLGDQCGRYAEYFYHRRVLRVLRIESHAGPATRRLDEVVASSDARDLVAVRAFRVSDEEIAQILPVPHSPGQWIVLDRSSSLFLVDNSAPGIFTSKKLDWNERDSKTRIRKLAFNPEGTRIFAQSYRRHGILTSPWPKTDFGSPRPVIVGDTTLRIQAMMPLSKGRILVSSFDGALVVINDGSFEVVKVLVDLPKRGQENGYYETMTRSGRSVFLTATNQWGPKKEEKGLRVVRDNRDLDTWVIPFPQTRFIAAHTLSPDRFVAHLHAAGGILVGIDANAKNQEPIGIAKFNRRSFSLSPPRNGDLLVLDHVGDINLFRETAGKWTHKTFPTTFLKSISTSAHSGALSMVGLRNGEVVDLVWRSK